MAVSFSFVPPPGLFSQQYPPPLLPKPRKDNARLQKLLKKTAKKKVSSQAVQSAAPFRSSLSPVNEASPDLERSDHSTPPKTPETPFYRGSQAPRFTARPLYQHVPSPYPHRVAYGRAARFSPQTVAASLYSFSQHVAPVGSYLPRAHQAGLSPVPGAAIPAAGLGTSGPSSSVPEVTGQAVHMTVVSVNTPRVRVTPAPPTARSPAPTPVTGSPAMMRPLTVLTPLIKPRSPRPTFKATETSKSPKPMFDVPQIRMYTATTSYYETSRTPPVYDTAGLTAIGNTLPIIKTPTSELLRAATPAPEEKRGSTPTPESKRAATPTGQTAWLTTDPQSQTPPETKRGTTPATQVTRVKTPTPEVKRVTPTPEVKRVTPTPEVKWVTPNPEVKRAPLTPEVKRARPTPEVKRVTLTPEVKRVTPTPEVRRAKTPTYELPASRSPSRHPKTPSYSMARAKTPVFEISRPNPLLFAVSPITVEPERSKTPTGAPASLPASQRRKPTEPESTETHAKQECVLNGDLHPDEAPVEPPAAMSTPERVSKSESTHQKAAVPGGKSLEAPTDAAVLQRPKTPTSEAAEPAAHAAHRPKTPTHQTAKPEMAATGYQRPKTARRGVSPSRASPVTCSRPKTPTSVPPRSAYRGLTPAEYVAYGGIQSYSPAFSMARSKTPTPEEATSQTEAPAESRAPGQEALAAVAKVEERSTEVDKPHPRDEQTTAAPPTVVVPTIVVSEAGGGSETTPWSQESRKMSSRAAERRADAVLGAKPAPQKPEVSSAAAAEEEEEEEEEEAGVSVNEVPPSASTDTEAPAPAKPSQLDTKAPLTTTTKPVARGAVQTGDGGTAPLTRAGLSQHKRPPSASAALQAEAEGPTPSAAAPLAGESAAGPPTSNSDTRTSLGEAGRAGSAPAAKSVPEHQGGEAALPRAEPLLKVTQKLKGLKSKSSGWSRLKKHMVVEQEEPKFPDLDSHKEARGQEESKAHQAEEKAEEIPGEPSRRPSKSAPKATQMWDAVLFQMFSSKENIMHQIELNKSEEEKAREDEEEAKHEPKEIPAFAHRLPVLLFSPRFDAKRLKEAASRPVTKFSMVFEMGLIGRKNKDEEPKDFNRTAKGFTGL